MQARTPSHFARMLASRNGTINVLNAGGKVFEGPVYGSAKPFYSWVAIDFDRTSATAKMITTYAQCRGWIYEAYYELLKGNTNACVQSVRVNKRMIEDGVVTVLAVSSKPEQMQVGIDMLNTLEKRARWAQTRMFPTKAKNGYLIVASKNWRRNLPLISALLLFPRVTAQYPKEKSEDTGRYTTRLANYVNNLASAGIMDTSAFRMAMEGDLLLKLMVHSRAIIGKDAYKKIASRGRIHSTGIGDFSILTHFLKDKYKEGEKKHPSEYKTGYNWSYMETTEAHGDMAVRAVKYILPKKGPTE